MTSAAWWRDDGFTIHLVRHVRWCSAAVAPPDGEWQFEIDGSIFWVPEGCEYVPQVGDFAMVYPTSRATNRGIIINGIVIEYRTAREYRERSRDFWLAQVGSGAPPSDDDCRRLAGVMPWS